MLNHGNPEVVIFLIWYTLLVFYFIARLETLLAFLVEGRMKEQI